MGKSPLVMKFGGAALSTPDHFATIAQLIEQKRPLHSSITIVVSAMGKMTDQLIELAHAVNKTPPKREYDMLVTVGERISMSLLAMALAAKGIDAVSFTGSQSGIITCGSHSEATILEVRPTRIREVLGQGKVAIVAGFQGVSRDKEITTLGRGGSDTTAVALGAAIGAPLVEFYKDVPGIFTDDPKKDPNARHIPFLTFTEAKRIVNPEDPYLHPESLELAKKQQITLRFHAFQDPKIYSEIFG